MVLKIGDRMDKQQKSGGNQQAEKKKPENGFFGVEAEGSLQSVNFATTENPYLNEHFQEEPDE